MKSRRLSFRCSSRTTLFKWSEPDRQPLPPITDVASTIDLGAFKTPTMKLPIVSVCLVGFAILCLLTCLLTGSGWKVLGIVAVLCGLASIFTTGVMPREIENPFASRRQFKIEDEDAKQVFAQLHKNMFRAFDYRQESDVYDALAKSVDGALLRQLYLDVNDSLRVKEQGGAAANVTEVNLMDGSKKDLQLISKEDTPGFRYRCRWNLIGTIEHWGHIHERTNEYDAEFKVQVRDNAWKITSMNVLDEEQGVVKTDLRKF